MKHFTHDPSVPSPTSPTTSPWLYSDEYLTVPHGAEMVTVEGRTVRLTPSEGWLLACLAGNEGRTLTAGRLLHEVWGPDYEEQYGDYVHIYVWRLRQKLERDPKQPRYIHGNGGGYRFEKADWVRYAFQSVWDTAACDAGNGGRR